VRYVGREEKAFFVALLLFVVACFVVGQRSGGHGARLHRARASQAHTPGANMEHTLSRDASRTTGYVVPLAFHVVRRSDGSGGIDEARLVRALDDANLHFAGAGIVFCWPGPVDYIDSNDLYYNIDTQAEIDALRSINPVSGAINVYFTANLADENGPLCGVSSFTWDTVQGIVVDNDCTALNGDHSTFSHQIGHYLDLLDTHETAFGQECVDGSNCATAGDLLCDTPADPMLGAHNVDPNCVYVGTETDACNGESYHPDTTNLMSDAPAECRASFSAGQENRAWTTLANLRPDHIAAFCPGDGHWNLLAKLLAADGADYDHFSEALAMVGDRIVIGAPFHSDNGSWTGSAYVFRMARGIWVQEQELLPPDGTPNDQFGSSVAIFADRVAVGAAWDDENGMWSGSVYVFRLQAGTWTLEQKLLANDGVAEDWFGWSVAMGKDRVVVGAWGAHDRGPGSGAVYVFRWDGAQWVQEQKLSVPDGQAADHFGDAVATYGSRIAVGVPGDDDQGTDSGSAYVFRWDGEQWVQEQKVLPANGTAGDWFGSSIAIGPNRLIVGAYGEDTNGEEAGAAYVFRWNGSQWLPDTVLLAPAGAAYDHFAENLALEGDRIVVGAHGDNFVGDRSGAAYVYRWDGSQWFLEQTLLATDPTAGDSFGYTVAVSGDRVAVGARRDDDRGIDSGSTYVFRSLDALRNSCLGDLDGDLDVDLDDLTTVLQNLQGGNIPASGGDADGDGDTDLDDLTLVLSRFGNGCL